MLWSVGELSSIQAELLKGMTPKLASTYGIDGRWQDVVAMQMRFSPDVADALRGMWERTLTNAGRERDTVDPEFWAQQVVDSNFI